MSLPASCSSCGARPEITPAPCELVRIECVSCGQRGPEYKTIDRAREAWNMQMLRKQAFIAYTRRHAYVSPNLDG